MRVGCYMWIYAEAGKHVFEVKATTLFSHIAKSTLEKISLDVEAGHEYYLGFEQNFEDLHPVLTPFLPLLALTRTAKIPANVPAVLVGAEGDSDPTIAADAPPEPGR